MAFNAIDSISTFLKQNLNKKHFRIPNLKLPSLILLSLLLIAGLFQNCAENGLDVPESIKPKPDACTGPEFTVTTVPTTSGQSVAINTDVKLSLTQKSNAPANELDNASIVWTIIEGTTSITKKEASTTWNTGNTGRTVNFNVEAQSKTCSQAIKTSFSINVQAADGSCSQKVSDLTPYGNLSVDKETEQTYNLGLVPCLKSTITQIDWYVEDSRKDNNIGPNSDTFKTTFPTAGKQYKIKAKLYTGTPAGNPQETKEAIVTVKAANTTGGGTTLTYDWKSSTGNCVPTVGTSGPGKITTTYSCQDNTGKPADASNCIGQRPATSTDCNVAPGGAATYKVSGTIKTIAGNILAGAIVTGCGTLSATSDQNGSFTFDVPTTSSCDFVSPSTNAIKIAKYECGFDPKASANNGINNITTAKSGLVGTCWPYCNQLPNECFTATLSITNPSAAAKVTCDDIEVKGWNNTLTKIVLAKGISCTSLKLTTSSNVSCDLKPTQLAGQTADMTFTANCPAPPATTCPNLCTDPPACKTAKTGETYWRNDDSSWTLCAPTYTVSGNLGQEAASATILCEGKVVGPLDERGGVNADLPGGTACAKIEIAKDGHTCSITPNKITALSGNQQFTGGCTTNADHKIVSGGIGGLTNEAIWLNVNKTWWDSISKKEILLQTRKASGEIETGQITIPLGSSGYRIVPEGETQTTRNIVFGIPDGFKPKFTATGGIVIITLMASATNDSATKSLRPDCPKGTAIQVPVYQHPALSHCEPDSVMLRLNKDFQNGQTINYCKNSGQVANCNVESLTFDYDDPANPLWFISSGKFTTKCINGGLIMDDPNFAILNMVSYYCQEPEPHAN